MIFIELTYTVPLLALHYMDGSTIIVIDQDKPIYRNVNLVKYAETIIILLLILHYLCICMEVEKGTLYNHFHLVSVCTNSQHMKKKYSHEVACRLRYVSNRTLIDELQQYLVRNNGNLIGCRD